MPRPHRVELERLAAGFPADGFAARRSVRPKPAERTLGRPSSAPEASACIWMRRCYRRRCLSPSYLATEVGLVAVIRIWEDTGCSTRSVKPAALTASTSSLAVIVLPPASEAA